MPRTGSPYICGMTPIGRHVTAVEPFAPAVASAEKNLPKDMSADGLGASGEPSTLVVSPPREVVMTTQR
jgi:hypothetical protein